MKINRFIPVAAALLFLTYNNQLSTCFAQGSLTPPGPPAPTMKSLDQIEARTPISSVPFTISTSGSYYLTMNLIATETNAIVIAANSVTLDLNGFTISSTAADAANGGTAILLTGTASGASRDITILNGHIEGGVTNNGSGVYSGPGFGYGINNPGTSPWNVRVTGISVSGCLFDGIALNPLDATGIEGIVVEGSLVRTVGGNGIVAGTIKNSTAVDCGSDAIDGYEISDCRGEAVSGYGISATSSAFNCYGSGNGYAGVAALLAKNCNGQSQTGTGLEAAASAENCIGESSSGYGLNANSAQNCYGQSQTGTGLDAGSSAENCYGKSTSNTGLNATIAQNCRGASVSGTGINAKAAENCYGTSGSGTGVYADIAQNCYGESTNSGPSNTGVGLAALVGINCEGLTQGSGSGLDANFGNTCYGASANGPTGLTSTYGNFCIGMPPASVLNKYNMP
jgi:hypothetical protein